MVAKRTPVVLASALICACTDFSIDDSDSNADKPTIIEETFLQDPTPRVDLLWMMDNTSSMETEHAHLAGVIGDFMQELDSQGVSWHLGFITPDGGGVLEGNPWVLTTSNVSPDRLANSLNVGLDGSLPQTGLAALIRALSEPLVSTDNSGFRRDNAALHMVVYADGDDQSDAVLGSDPVGQLLTFLDEESTRTGLPAVLSAVVGPEESGCLGPSGSATSGKRYLDAAISSGGATTSICNPDLPSIAEAVTDVSIALSTQFELQAAPVERTIRVAINEDRIEGGWSIDGRSLVFETPPDYGATISVRYEVAR